MSDKTLICYTASFPYGLKETYFETELYFLSKHFSKVILVPIYNPYSSFKLRNVPKNVEVESPLLGSGKDRVFSIFFNLKLRKSYLDDFFNNSIYFSISKLKRWINSNLLFSAGVVRTNKIVRKYNLTSRDVVLYSYWANCPFFLSEDLFIFKRVVRMHGGDFYLERNNNYIPVHKNVFDSVDLLLPISKNIMSRLISDFSQPATKIRLSYLGSINSSLSSKLYDKNPSAIKIISCSNVVSLKRIDKIIQILKNADFKVNWMHIGDGNLMSDVINKAKMNLDLNKNVNFLFVGQKTQTEISEIYTNNYFDWFVNVSEYEGLPVSIMEAYSYGIPAIATNVGGTSEIVNDSNGFLIKKEFNENEVLKIITFNYRTERYFKLRKGAFESWKLNFDANKNFEDLGQYIERL